MRPITKFVSASLVLLLMLVMVPAAEATVAVTAGPTSLVLDPIVAPASSAPMPLFSFTLAFDAAETLSSVSLVVSPNGTTTVAGPDLASLALYKDTGNGIFESGLDTLLGTQSAVNLSPTSTIVTPGAPPPATGKFFVTLSTSASWSGGPPPDRVKVLMPADAVTSSGGAVSSAMAETNSITADTAGPILTNAIAKNTGGTGAKESGDSVELWFSESTNKPAVNSGNVNAVLPLSSGHSWLSSDGILGSATWNVEGTRLTLTLGATTTASSTVATVAVGDTVTVSGATVKDLAGNSATGSKIIAGNFSGPPADDGDDDDDGKHKGRCGNGLQNGRLYKVKGAATVYLAAACRLKAFRGAAVFHAKGKKFQNIIELDSLSGLDVKPGRTVKPSEGTILKGRGPTVYIIVLEGSRKVKKAFRSAAKFFALGFHFGQITEIEDEDLAAVEEGSAVADADDNLSGSLLKCEGSATVYEIVGGKKFAFRSAEAFLERGHAWRHVGTISCERLNAILSGAPIDD